ncbi:double-stranded RNA-specific editase Adar [Aethina tumida]|uniref:double-stranded RNA-specific editase Adar n=1 Tax=Aethina tumida TaxID=116153 RepID=UPI00096B4A96|nr:double-stranded RNA-specific editase Adar [Aethina tumida]
MSYNRKSFGNHPNVNNVGQRRPIQNNFIPGGSLAPQKNPLVVPPMKQQQQMQQQQQQQQQQMQQMQQQQQLQPPPLRPPGMPGSTGNMFRPAPQAQSPKKQEPIKVEVSSPVQPKQDEQAPPSQQDQLANEPVPQEGGDQGNRIIRPWFRKTAKITKKEKQRRRNMKLSKMLQPKNAVMILNELVRTPSFTLTDVPEGFQAVVVIDDVEHVGLGRSKNQAKNNAAESAIRYIIKKQKFRSTTQSPNENGEVKMDVDEAGGETPLPWQHVASLALFKLFTSWNEDVRCEERIDHKPAKKMPANPEMMQPLMLLNQMLPHAEFEEIGKVGTPPNIQFTFRCRVDNQTFDGTGPNKKLAKKFAAFAACHKILNVNYPPQVWSPAQ